MTNACQHCAHGFLRCSERGFLTVGNSAGSNFNFNCFALFAFQSMPVADSRALSAHLQGILSHELPPRPPHSYRLRLGYEVHTNALEVQSLRLLAPALDPRGLSLGLAGVKRAPQLQPKSFQIKVLKYVDF